MLVCLILCSMPRHLQSLKPVGLQRQPLCQHGEDLQQLHCGAGEPGDHLYGGTSWPVLPQGKEHLLDVEPTQIPTETDGRRFCFYIKTTVRLQETDLNWKSVFKNDPECLRCSGSSCALNPAVEKVVNTGQMYRKTTQANVQTCTYTCSDCNTMMETPLKHAF